MKKIFSSKSNVLKGPLKDEIFLSCISYEDRSLSTLKFLERRNKFSKGIFILNEEIENLDSVIKKKKTLEKDLEKYFDDYFIIKIPKNLECKGCGIFLRKSINNQLKNQKISSFAVEISTFKRYQLLLTIHFLSSYNKPFRFFYISPESYGKWQSEDYASSQTLPFLVNKTFDNQKPNFLLVILGFEIKRALQLIDDLMPDIAVFGKISPPTSEKHGYIQDMKLNEEFSYVIDNFLDKNILNIHGYDLDKVIGVLNQIITKQKEKWNIFISMMGPKSHLLALYQIYKNNQNFNFYYNRAKIYNFADYSTGIDKIFEFHFNENFIFEDYKKYNIMDI